jgi:cytochrome d ubiquinol oxidase subunit II
VAQWPYLLPESLKVTSGAAPDATLWSILVVFVVAGLVILPSLGLLYYLDQRSLLESDTATDADQPA